MPRKEETSIVKKILSALKERYPSAYLRKIYGSPFQHAGIPDIVGCIEGRFIGLEVKTTSGRISEIQKIEGEDILLADGIYGVVTGPEEALEVVFSGLNSITGL